MCSDGISHRVMSDATIQEMMSNPIMDLVHKQVVMILYSLEADKRLHEYKQWLPIYLSQDWTECSAIIGTIERAGLLKRSGDSIALIHKIEADDSDVACACHS